MKIISFDDIVNLNIEMTQCYQWAKDMIANKKTAYLPPKTHMNMPGNVFCNIMPSIIYCDGMQIGGVKVVTRYPKRIPALDSKILLFNAENGDALALMDGNWITAMRTGAVAAHSIVNFAKSNYENIGIIGLGNTARATLLILNEVEKNRSFSIKLLSYKNQADLYKARFNKYDNLSFEVYDTVEEVVRGSDVVISCATYFENDICEDNCFEQGVLVVPVHTRGFTNCDLFFDKVFADDTGHVDHFRYFSRFKYYAEVSDVVNGDSKGRENDTERILTDNIGVSTHDIYYAAHIYKLLETKQSVFSQLQDADMHEPLQKFWV